MTVSGYLLVIGLTLLGFILSALYSGLETGLYTLNPVRLRIRAAHGDTRAITMRRWLRRPGRTLMVLLIGTNAANYLGTWGVAELLHTSGISDRLLIVLEALIMTPLLFVFAETLPKDLFRTYTDRWTYWFAPAITISRWCFTITGLLPLVAAMSGALSRVFGGSPQGDSTARERVSQLIREGVGAGVISLHQVRLTDQALAMSDQCVSDVMVPWRSVLCLPLDAGQKAREALISTRNFSRLPVVETGGRVAGVVSWVDLIIDRDTPTATLMAETVELTPDASLPEALATLRHHRATLAIVRANPNARPLGIVTMKDLVEPLTGKLAAW